MKDVRLFTFDEMEIIRYEIDNMIDNAKEGAYGERDGKTECEWLIEDLKKFRSKFE